MYHIGEILVGKRVQSYGYALFRKHTPKQAEIKTYRFQSLVGSKKYAKKGGGGGRRDFLHFATKTEVKEPTNMTNMFSRKQERKPKVLRLLCCN